MKRINPTYWVPALFALGALFGYLVTYELVTRQEPAVEYIVPNAAFQVIVDTVYVHTTDTVEVEIEVFWTDPVEIYNKGKSPIRAWAYTFPLSKQRQQREDWNRGYIRWESEYWIEHGPMMLEMGDIWTEYPSATIRALHVEAYCPQWSDTVSIKQVKDTLVVIERR